MVVCQLDMTLKLVLLLYFHNNVTAYNVVQKLTANAFWCGSDTTLSEIYYKVTRSNPFYFLIFCFFVCLFTYLFVCLFVYFFLSFNLPFFFVIVVVVAVVFCFVLILLLFYCYWCCFILFYGCCWCFLLVVT